MKPPQLDPELILSIRKPPGWTSFQVVKKIRDHFHFRKIGHGGTLDPFATGVILILIGKATRKFDDLMQLDKAYRAEIEFGIETDTLDVDGKIIKRQEMPVLDEAKLKIGLLQFVGEITQVPPRFSALKYRGKPLYKYAREGVEVEPEPRKVHVHQINLIKYAWPRIEIDVVCSKGTYIRSLARDLGEAFGGCAYLRALERTRIGAYHLEDALEVDELLKTESIELQ